MANNLDLKVRITAQLGELRKGLDTLLNKLDETGAKGAKAGRQASEGISGFERAVSRATNTIAGFVTIYSAIAAVKTIADITDQYAQLDARLKIVTDSTEEYARAQRETYRIAQETRAPLEGTIETYAKLEQATETLGTSQDQLLLVTETINKAIALTPVSAESARASLVQFGQGLASGALRGEELNSILEQTPGLAKAIADGLDRNVGDLKKMGEAGELTAERLLAALTKVSSSVDEEFRQLPVTVGQALTQLRNDVLVTFGGTDVTPLTEALQDLRATITDPAVVQGITTIASALVNLTGTLISAIAEVANFMKWVGEELASKVNGIAGDDLPRLNGELIRLQEKIAELERTRAGSVWVKIFGTEGIDRLIAENIKQLEEVEAKVKAAQQAQDEAAQAQANRKKADEESRRALEEKAKAELAAAQAAAETKRKDDEAKKAAEQRQKQVDSMLASLQEEAATYGKSAEEVVRYRLALLGASQAEQERAAALVRQIEDLKAKEQAEKDAAKAADERKEAEKKLASDMEDIRIRALEASGRTVEARAAELQRQYDPIIAQLKEKGDDAGIALVNGLINTELAQARLDEMQAKISAATDKVAATEDSVDSRVQIGEITGVQGQEELRAAREQAILELQAVKAEIQALGAESPEAAAAIAQIDEEMAKLAGQNVTGAEAALRRLRTELADLETNFGGKAIENLSDGLGNALADIATGAKSAEDAFKDMARNFIASLAQMAAQALAKKAILSLFGPTGGIFAGVLHTGGIAGLSGGTVRNVPAIAFAGAPRYHTGGIAGLKPGEVPAVLQQGEEVLTRDDPRHSLNGAGQAGGGNGVRIVNVVDPNLVQDFLTSGAGERVIVNAIQRNAGAIKQTLS